jgi:hypothetical protein
MASVVERFFLDEVNPSDDELLRWGYSSVPEPYEDFDIVIADPRHLAVLQDMVQDLDCPKRQYFLSSLYCMVGHSDRTDLRLIVGIDRASQAADPWLRTWGMRARHVVANPEARRRQDWCGWPGLRP